MQAKALTIAIERFFVGELKDIYWAEKHLTKALPKMQKAATSPELQKAFADHLVQTNEHVTRLEQVFELLEEKPQAKKCDAMAGIIEEGEGLKEEIFFLFSYTCICFSENLICHASFSI